MNQYIPLKSRTSELGDAYYRCVAESLTKRGAKALDECVRIGHDYRTALLQQLKDLSRLRDPAFVQRERELINEYLKLVESDLDKFTKGEIDKVIKRLDQ